MCIYIYIYIYKGIKYIKSIKCRCLYNRVKTFTKCFYVPRLENTLKTAQIEFIVIFGKGMGNYRWAG